MAEKKSASRPGVIGPTLKRTKNLYIEVVGMMEGLYGSPVMELGPTKIYRIDGGDGDVEIEAVTPEGVRNLTTGMDYDLRYQRNFLREEKKKRLRPSTSGNLI